MAVRLGLRQIRGLSNADGARIVGARTTTAFETIEDVWRRSGVQRAAIEKLADGDAFHGFSVDRRQGLWKVRGLRLALRCLLPYCLENWPLTLYWDAAAQDNEIGRAQGVTAAFNGIVRQPRRAGFYEEVTSP